MQDVNAAPPNTALLSYAEAAACVAARAARVAASGLGTECLPLAQAAGRVLARRVVADRDQPPFDRSTRDGFACRAEEAGAGRSLQIAGMTHAGEPPAAPLPPGSAWEIMTGAPVPPGADAVVMLEHVEQAGGTVRLAAGRTLHSGDNVVPRGAQAGEGSEQLAAGIRLDAAQIALAASCGAASVEVFVRPRVAILTTGDELVPVDAAPGPGQIRNSNAPMLAALASAAGGDPWVLPTAADTAEALDAALGEALASADLLILSGGVSAGKFDLVEPALARRGAHFHFTGVRMQPGKPLVFGEVPRQAGAALTFFGLPGNPVSSAVTFQLFATRMLGALAGQPGGGPRFATARLQAAVKGKPGLTRFLPAVCDWGAAADAGPIREPAVCRVDWQGSGDLTAFGRANCFLVVPDGTAALDAGDRVRILLS